MEVLKSQQRPAAGTPFHRILVPTVDTVRHHFILQALLMHKHHSLIVGTTGCRNTSMVQALLEAADQNTLALSINFSAASTAETTQEMIESRLDRRQRNTYGKVS